VCIALQNGYRHIDTALAYGNEREVGQGIKDSGVPRKDIWITTKLDNTWHKRVPEGIESSLKSLCVDYVDLYLIVSRSFQNFLFFRVKVTDFLQALAMLYRPRRYGQAVGRLGLCQDLVRCSALHDKERFNTNPRIEMQKLVGTGKVRNIGVSNFGIKHMESLEAHPEYKITPAVNQIELHPNNPSSVTIGMF
jgi:glycerol 2-dehydrogenase (NADP+)